MKNKLTLLLCALFVITALFFTTPAKATNNPAWKFLEGYDSTGYSYAYSAALRHDKHGYLYMAGNFSSQNMQLGNYTLYNTDTTAFYQNGYAAKFDTLGNVIWAFAFGVVNNQSGTDITGLEVDSLGNMYIAGDFYNGTSLTIGSYVLVPVNTTSNEFIAKISPNGTVLWAKIIAEDLPSNSLYGPLLTFDKTGNLLLAISASYTNNIIYGADTINLPGGNAGGSVAFMKLDINGNFIWGKGYGMGTTTIYANGLKVDGNNNILLMAQVNLPTYTVALHFDTVSVTLPPRASGTSILCKFTAAPTCLWAQQLGGYDNFHTFFQSRQQLDIDPQQNILVGYGITADTAYFGHTLYTYPGTAGYFKPFIAKYNTNGALQWVNTITKGNGYAQNITVDAAGNSYLGGFATDSTIVAGSVSLLTGFRAGNVGSQSGFLLQYNANGTPQWGKVFGDINNTFATQSHVAIVNGSVFVGGGMRFGSYFDGRALTGSLFLGELGPAAAAQTLSVNVTTVNANCTDSCNGSATATATNNTGNVSYIWVPGNANTASVTNLCPGTYKVIVHDNVTYDTTLVTIAATNTAPATPAITAQSDTLTATATGNVHYLWFYNGNVINGDTTHTYIATQNGNYTVQVTNQNNCGSTSAAYTYPATGINVIDNARIVISPNPVSNVFTISTQQKLLNASVKIIDITGRIVIENTNVIGNNFTVDIASEPAGIYFVEVLQNENKYTVKLVKE